MHATRPILKRRRAFTILELMLAIVIFAGVMAAIYACWAAVLRGTRAGMTAAADVQRERVARRAFEEALNSVVMYVENRRHYAFIADTAGQYAYLSFVARLPATFPGSGMFGDLSVRRVTFSVEPATNGAMQLLMTQAPILLATNQDQEPYTLVLAKNVTQFSVRFWATNAGVAQWADEWLLTNQLPALIEYGLVFNATGEPQHTPSVANGIVAPPAVAVPEQYRTPAGPGGSPGGGSPGGTGPGPRGTGAATGGTIGIGSPPKR
ncbi:MAG: prepilin-type N-terminal cleavage/methylation domain-containing protein [Verrucomicrobia bacterium]|nr:prepilin-type N-terminal cleavage/methylation domain-containing protein [Verrucomicrobiota bacterium]